MFRFVIAAVLSLGLATATAAETPTPQLLGERLQAGELAALEQDLVMRLAAAPQGGQTRFALGATQFLRTVEGLSQAMYRHGLEPSGRALQQFPFFRFPLPRNPAPERLDYQTMRGIFKTALAGLEQTEATLAPMGQGEVKLPVAFGLVKLDLNGDGKAEEQETLWRVLDATLGGGNIPQQAAEAFSVSFDRADAAWLRGYSHLLSALIEFGLAHDQAAGFNASFQMFFPRAGLPGSELNSYVRPDYSGMDDGAIADAIAYIHLMHWEVTEPERLVAALAHLESVVALSRESWRFILAESDDEAEWIPSPRQNNGVLPGAAITQQTVDGWMVFLAEFDSLLQGKKLIPHWRLAKGINFHRIFTEPRPFDPILWAQGSAALPYLEDGPMTGAETWDRMMQMFEGNFFGYAMWFN